jgi:Zn-dependent protease with chaperone function
VHHATIVALAVAAGGAAASLLVPRRIRPQAAAPLITLLAVLSASAAVWTLLLIAGTNLAQLHGIAERLSWCSDVVSKHRGELNPVGGMAIFGLIVSFGSALRVRRRQRSLRAPAGDEEIAVVGSDVPTAFALPGRPGRFVVSTGMLHALDPDERRVLFAHERAHLRCHHHRYVRLTQLAAASFPVLTPLNGRVRLATERWADEEAVRDVGDRTVVARAVARAAIAQTDAPVTGLGMADTGVLERVESLLQGAPRRARLLELGFIGGALVAGIALAGSVVLIEPALAAVFGLC